MPAPGRSASSGSTIATDRNRLRPRKPVVSVASVLASAALAFAAPATTVRGYRLRLDVPPGWHARVYERPGGSPILQAANMRLSPSDEDDPAVRTQKRLHRRGIVIVLFEVVPPRGQARRWNSGFPVLH